ncbi:hypothetical protein PIB30_096615 [Stylosanthes scabra]|uniref:Uncharacterized protein n=1 Tax=Stylosanthes scabra TaxID=79078 RepID=A0ABU6YUW0_9FABA|nr:hypothetical protein [Stylosanthes scabra]
MMVRVRARYRQQDQLPQAEENEQDEQATPQLKPANPIPQGFLEQQGYGWEQLQQNLSAMRVQQTQFFENIQAQQEVHDMRTEQDYDMKVQKQQQKINDMRKQFGEYTRDFNAREAYCCWALQQTNPHLAHIPVTNILIFMRKNAAEKRALFEGEPMPGQWGNHH